MPNCPGPDVVELTGVYDAHPETAHKIAAKHSTRVFSSMAEAAAASRSAEHRHAHHHAF